MDDDGFGDDDILDSEDGAGFGDDRFGDNQVVSARPQ